MAFKFEIGVSSVEDVDTQYIHQQAKQMKMWLKWSNLSLKSEELVSVKLLTCWEFYFGHFGEY